MARCRQAFLGSRSIGSIWDGGLVSNTPLQYVLDYYPRRSRLCFQVDVFQGRGHLPKNLEEVSEREKDIRYSSRTRVNTDAFRQKHEVRHAINELHKLLPQEIARTEQAKRLAQAQGYLSELSLPAAGITHSND